MKLLAHFLPAPDAAPRAVRVAAARNALLGVITIALGTFLVLALDRATHGALLAGRSRLRFLAGIPSVLGWVVVATSCWRFAIGVHPAREPATATRRTIRLIFIAAVIALAMLAMIALSL